MDDLKFSVSMCVYGGDDADHFRQALESVYDQTRVPDEVVLTVDGPVPDAINQVISEYEQKDAHFRVFRLETNQGHGNARRLGFSKCLYDYIAIADADDINAKDRFETELAYFREKPTLGAVTSGCYHFAGDINNILNEEKVPVSDADIKEFLKKRCPLVQPSVMLNKNAVMKAGGYLDWYHGEDYYLWVRMYLTGASFAGIDRSLVYMRTDPDQMNRRGGMKYYKSMEKLFRYMLKNRIIGPGLYVYNCAGRFVMQVLMPNKLRAWVRKKML